MTMKGVEKNLIGLTLLLFIVFECFAGPLRMVFHMAGAEFLFSIPKLFILLTQACAIILVLYHRKVTVNGMIASVTIFYLIFVSMISSLPAAIFVGIWAVLPLFLGYHGARIIMSNIKEKKTNRIIVFIFLLSCLGVICNVFFNYPWYNVSYEIAGMDVSSSQIGSSGGYTRYAGFFKSSLQASANVLILLLYIVSTSKSKTLIIISFVFSALVALLTISKTIFLLHIILLLYILVKVIPVKVIWRITLTCAFMFAVFTIGSTNYHFNVSKDPMQVMLLASLNDRLTNTWPEGVKTIINNGNLFFGGGVGTIGVGSKLGTGAYNPGDSMYLYLIGSGGYLLGFILLFWAFYQSTVFNNGNACRYLSLLLIVLCLFGLSMTAPEYPFMALSMGFLINSRVYKAC
ncbi:hypothetical protein ACM615_20845 [Rahnella sp. PAMC25617]|uniref:hypothetical protein n=1 Tax=Rahnella sp. PAMC25617 TaxID=3399684 RepID=UPI003D36B3B6